MTGRALVTGASGFVGAYLAHRLVERGDAVHVAVRPGSDAWRLAGLDAERHEVDLTAAGAAEEMLRRARPDRIFHLATHGAYSSQRDAVRIAETNVVGTVRLVDAAIRRGFDSFVNAGSSSEYGFVDHAPDEDERPEPNSDYAVSKLGQTLYCRHRARAAGARIATLRLYSVYGPYEEPARFVPRLIGEGLSGRLPELAEPDTARDFVHVEDVARAFVLVAGHEAVAPGAIYNVGTGRQVTLREAVEVARRALAIEEEPRWGTMESRSWDTRSWRADPRRIERELGFRAAISFEDGFARFAAWVRAEPRREARYR